MLAATLFGLLGALGHLGPAKATIATASSESALWASSQELGARDDGARQKQGHGSKECWNKHDATAREDSRREFADVADDVVLADRDNDLLLDLLVRRKGHRVAADAFKSRHTGGSDAYSERD